MKTRTKSIPEQLKSQAETYVGDLSDIVFFDIETTGLSHKTAFLYLVGAAFMESGRFVLCQYLAEDLSEEEAVLKAFSERIHGKKRLIHFNGSTFDLPFLQARCRKYGLECAASAMEQTDLYRRNRIRHRILPVMEELNPEAVRHMGRTGEMLGELDAWLQENGNA